MIMDNSNKFSPDDCIKQNLVRSWAYEYLSQHDKRTLEAFPALFAKWIDSGRDEEKPSTARHYLHSLFDNLYNYFSSHDTSQLTAVDMDLILNGKAPPDSLLEISERLNVERLDLWGTSVPEEDTIINIVRGNLIGDDPVWLESIEMAARAARCSFPVLITGETGTGKELVARQIHANSRQAGHECLFINCGAIPESLIESELFGYTAGSFTGANSHGKEGWIEKAVGGTLVLDEIGELSSNAQVALLRTLQNGEVQKIGGEIVDVDFRLIAISNQPIEDLVEKGSFRRDLYYRIAVIQIHLPLLNERGDDAAIFAEYFMERFIGANPGLTARSISGEAFAKLKSHRWRGNVRELENVIARAMVLCRGEVIEPHHLVFELAVKSGDAATSQLIRRLHLLEEPVFSRIDTKELAVFLTTNRAMMTSSSYAKTFSLSNSTARRHLNILVDKNILKHRGSKRSSYYMLADSDNTPPAIAGGE